MDQFALVEKETTEAIRKEQQRLHSGEIDEQRYEEIYEKIMDDRRLSINNILTYWFH